MPLIKTPFISTQHGFQFVNRFEFPFSVMFQLPFVGPIDLDDIVYGLCGGMCFGALDYFHTGKTVPEISKVENIDTKYLLYLWDRQLDSLKLPIVLKVIEWMLLDEVTIAKRVSRWEIPKLRRRIDKGKPAVLALIRTHGINDPSQNHQVLATGYEFDPISKAFTAQLYDPNRRDYPFLASEVHCGASDGSATHRKVGREALSGNVAVRVQWA